MNKKILMIIAPKDFRDEEYFIPKNFFEEKGLEVITSSTKKGISIGTYGGEAVVDISADDVRIENFQAVVFVGGRGTLRYLNDEVFFRLAQEAVREKIILGAICISPVILALAGVLKRKRATVWSSSMERTPIKVLKENGADYKKDSLVSHGKIITANGPQAAKEFAEAIFSAIEKR